MAEISVEQKKGDLSWIWAVAAVIAVVALMAWLFSTQDQVRSTAIIPADTAAAADGSAAQGGDLAAIGATPDQFVGRDMLIQDIRVAAVLGSRGFWAEVPNANPVLVILAPEIADVSWLSVGDAVTVRGAVQPVTAEALAEWVQTQAIGPGARDEASIATHYFRADMAVEQ